MGPRPFRLTRYFTLASLVAFAVLGAALLLLQRGEERYFDRVQHDQFDFFAKEQAELLRAQRESARANLVGVHEAGHVTLARVFANALWESHFVPLVAQAQRVDANACRAAGPAQKACIGKVGARLKALPAFAAVDAPVRALMRGTSVFKIKVYDLRGLTVYSSDLSQVGEDKAANDGWRSAAMGRPASELVHRNQFSAFEGVVKDRDLLQSYVPVPAPGGGIGGVFEIYSDVTPLLQRLQEAEARSGAEAQRDQQRLREAAARNQDDVESASVRFLATIFLLLALTYAALLVFVRRGQGLIDRDALAREQAALREQEWHRDKMATLGAMAANISHEVGNPLAIISGLAQEIGHWRTPADIDPGFPREIVAQTTRIAAMTRRIDDFAHDGRDQVQALDIGERVRAVVEFLRFDRRFRGTPIELRLAAGLPACDGIPDHLTEVLMGLLLAFEQGCEGCGAAGGKLVAETAADGGDVIVRIRGECARDDGACRVPVDDPRLESAQRRIAAMGGAARFTSGAIEIRLRAANPPGPSACP